MDIIVTQQLTKNYGKMRGITDVSLNIQEGEFFGFIGPNGAGKSTTIRTLLGLIQPTSGKAIVLGKDITKDHSYLADVGYLPSESSFYASMKVKDMIALSADLHHCDPSYGRAIASRLQLDITRKVADLSLGNRKKVAIVCALLHQPKLIILDEPTSGLDPLMQLELFKILEEHHHQGATIVLSSHVLSEISKYCQRAAIIKEGKIIALDLVSELVGQTTKRVTLKGDVDVTSLEGKKDYQVNLDSQSFLYDGNITTLLQCLSSQDVKDIKIEEPELDEIFLHYYESERD